MCSLFKDGERELAAEGGGERAEEVDDGSFSWETLFLPAAYRCCTTRSIPLPPPPTPSRSHNPPSLDSSWPLHLYTNCQPQLLSLFVSNSKTRPSIHTRPKTVNLFQMWKVIQWRNERFGPLTETFCHLIPLSACGINLPSLLLCQCAGGRSAAVSLKLVSKASVWF